LTKESAAGAIEQCIREAGVPCYPVVEKPMEELQEKKLLTSMKLSGMKRVS